jgi:hypothetical protein
MFLDLLPSIVCVVSAWCWVLLCVESDEPSRGGQAERRDGTSDMSPYLWQPLTCVHLCPVESHRSTNQTPVQLISVCGDIYSMAAHTLSWRTKEANLECLNRRGSTSSVNPTKQQKVASIRVESTDYISWKVILYVVYSQWQTCPCRCGDTIVHISGRYRVLVSFYTQAEEGETQGFFGGWVDLLVKLGDKAGDTSFRR